MPKKAPALKPVRGAERYGLANRFLGTCRLSSKRALHLRFMFMGWFGRSCVGAAARRLRRVRHARPEPLRISCASRVRPLPFGAGNSRSGRHETTWGWQAHKSQPMRIVPEALFATLSRPPRTITREIRVLFPDHRFLPQTLDVQCDDSRITVRSVKLTSEGESQGTVMVDLRPYSGAVQSSRAMLVFAASDGATTVKSSIPVFIK